MYRATPLMNNLNNHTHPIAWGRSHDSLQIRPATIADLDALIRYKPTPVIHRDRLRDAQQPGFTYLVLELDHRVIGFVCLVFSRPHYWSDGDSRDYLPTAIDFFVDPALRGQGYGSYFLRTVEEMAAAAAATNFYLWVDPVENPRAHALYLRLGYQPIQKEPYPFHWEFIDSAGAYHGGDSWRLDLVKSMAYDQHAP